MAYSEAVRRAAAQAMERRRLAAALESEQRRKTAFAAAPELIELENRIATVGLSSLKAVLGGEPDGAAESMRDQIAELRDRQRALLRQHGLEENALEPVHVCRQCGDTGLLPGGQACACVAQLLREQALTQIKTISPLELCDFDTFSLEYYPVARDGEHGASSRDTMRQNFKECRQFAEHFPNDSRNLLMLGDAGLGKTHLALSIANIVLRRGCEVVYCSAANIFRQIEIEHFEGGRDTTTLDTLKRCDLLVLDDLGAEFVSPFVNSVFYDIVNTRILRNRPTIYTTNITKDEVLVMRYGEKIASRLVGCATVLPFFGDDIRIKKGELAVSL